MKSQKGFFAILSIALLSLIFFTLPSPAQDQGITMPLVGKVIENTGSILKVEATDPTSGQVLQIIVYTSGAQITAADGTTIIPLSSILVEHFVEVNGTFDSSTMSVQASTIKDVSLTTGGGGTPPTSNAWFVGKVIEAGTGYLKFETTDATGTTIVNYDNYTKFRDQDGQSTTDIPAAGSYAHGEGVSQPDGSILALMIQQDPAPPDGGGGGGGGPTPGEPIPFGGQITNMGTGFLDLKSVDPNTGDTFAQHIVYDPALQITDEAGSSATLAIGDFVYGTGVNEGTSISASEIKKVSGGGGGGGTQNPIGGTVTEVGTDYIVVEVDTPEGKKSIKAFVDSDTKIYDQNGHEIPLSSLVVGDFVSGNGEIRADGTARALVIQKGGGGISPGGTSEFGGQVTEVGTDYLLLQFQTPEGENKSMKVLVYASTQILDENGQSVALNTIVVGDFVNGNGEFQGEGEVKALTIQKGGQQPGGEPHFFVGKILEKGTDYIVVESTTPEGNTERLKVFITSETMIQDEQGASITLDAFSVGDEVSGEGEFSATGDVKASRIQKGRGSGGTPGEQLPFGGKIVNLGTDFFELEGQDPATGNTFKIKIVFDSQTQAQDKNGNPVTLAVGDFVFGDGERMTDGTIKALIIQKGETPSGNRGGNFIGGQVSEIGSNYIMIQNQAPDGSMETIKVLVDAKTQITDQEGNPVQLNTLTSGGFVAVTGNFQPDGTVLALSISLGGIKPPEQGEVYFSGRLVETGADNISIASIDPTGNVDTLNLLKLKIGAETKVEDADGQPAGLSTFIVGDILRGTYTKAENGDNIAVLLVLQNSMPRPGEHVVFPGKILSIDAVSITVEILDPEAPVSQAKVNLVGQVPIKDDEGFDMTPADLSIGDIIDIEGVVTQDTKSVDPTLLRYHYGSFLKLGGTVVSVRADGFDLETRDKEGKIIVLQVVYTAQTVFLNEQTQTNLSKDAIIKGMEIKLAGKLISTSTLQAKGVLIPSPKSQPFAGKVTSIAGAGFVVESKYPDKDLFFKVNVNTSAGTIWLIDENGKISPGGPDKLIVGAYVRGLGQSSGSLAINADTVWVVKTQANLQVAVYHIIDGRRDGFVFTFKLNLNEPFPGQPQKIANGKLNLSADVTNMKGDVTVVGEPTLTVNMNKISGEPGKITGSWSGAGSDGVPLAADLVRTGDVVTGTVTRGGAAATGSGGGPQAGTQTTLRGKVTNISGSTLLISFYDNLNQLIQKPVLVFQGTVIKTPEGLVIQLPIDSLRNRQVSATGIVQSDLSILANTIVLETVISGNPITSAKWDQTGRTVQFTGEAKYFDSQASGTVVFTLTLAANGSNLAGTAVTSGLSPTTYNLALTRVSGQTDGPAGAWNGGASTAIGTNTKIWSVFLNLSLKDGVLSGSYNIGEGRIKTEVVVQNHPPEIDPFTDITATEGQSIEVQVSAKDQEGDTIRLYIPGVPLTGSTFTDNGKGSGTFKLVVPRLPLGKGELIITFVARDSKGAESSRILKIKVLRVNQPPVIGDIPQPIRLLEGMAFSFAIPVMDPDGDPLTFTFQGLPTEATLLNNVISYTPPFGSAKDYAITVTVKDGKGGEATKTFTIRVEGTNRPPRFNPVPLIEGKTGTPVTFTVQAVDPDQGDKLTYSVLQVSGVPVLPKGAVFDSLSGQFTWTPALDQVGPFKAAFVVADSKGARDQLLVSIFIGAVSLPPTVEVIDSTAVNQGVPLQFTVKGSTTTGRKLSYSVRDLPRGAMFDNTNGNFSWTPDFTQKWNFKVKFGVGDGSFLTEKTVTITVNAVVLQPVLARLADFTAAEGQSLTFQVSGSYPDGKRVVFDKPSSLPTNAVFDVVTGTFRFVPDYNQAGIYNLTFSVTGSDSKVTSVSNKVTVLNTNRSPSLSGLSNMAVKVGDNISLQVQATDPDSGDVLVITASGLPQGSTFNSTSKPAVFTWTPSADGNYSVTFVVTDAGQASDRRTIFITVGTANQPPSIGSIGQLTVSEGDTLILPVSISDPEGDPVTVLINPLPDNATFDSDNNTFTFEPSYSQAGIYDLKVIASDGELTDEEAMTITVTDVSLPPVITVQSAWSVPEGDTLEFTVIAIDVSGASLGVVSSSLPGGAVLDGASGRFFWSPDYDQAGTYQVTFIAGTGAQTAEQGVEITVTDQNRPPVIFEISDQKVVEGEMIMFEITTTDPDGDPVTIVLDSTQTPYINSVDIRNNSVFVFNTALLDKNLQIPSAVFTVIASDNRGGTDSSTIAFKIIRREDVPVPPLNPDDTSSVDFHGMGLRLKMKNKGKAPVSGRAIGSEVSGSLEGGGGGTFLASALAGRYSYLSRSKDKVVVQPFLSGTGAEGGDFYGIRRGWGLDLTSMQSSLTTMEFKLTLQYEDRDIPARDIPEFTESSISIFGLNSQGNFVQLPTELDTIANTAAATIDLSLYSDVTLGVILDLKAPVISSTTQLSSTADELGPYAITATVVDNVLVRSAKLYFAVEGQTFQVITMNPVAGKMNLYSTEIPGQKEGAVIQYYIVAGDSTHTISDPVDAPKTTYRFSVLMDGTQAIRAGDLDNNGKIDIFDLLGILKVLGGSQAASGGADVDGNGKVDIFDLLAILRLLAG